MEAPLYTDLAKAAGISPSYANQITTGARIPPRALAIHIFRKTGWRHDSIADLTEEQMALLEQLEPWQPREPAPPPTPKAPPRPFSRRHGGGTEVVA